MTTSSQLTLPWRAQSPRDNLHVAYGVLSLQTGGIERLVVDLVRDGQRRGCQTTVICLDERGQLAPQVEAAGGDVVCLSRPPGRSASTARAAERVLAELRPDVIHTHQVGALWYLGQAARTLGIPVVHTEHSDHFAHARGWLAKLKVWLRWRQARPLAQRLCCVSDDIAQRFARLGISRRANTQVVVNGIDATAFEAPSDGNVVRAEFGIPTGALVIGTIGRLAEVKRQDLLIRAFAALRACGKHPQTWLLIVGDGPERERLARLAAALNVRERLIFAGWQSQPQRFLQAMDVFVLSSRHEGLPLVLLEAWAAGLPVVASAVGGIPRTVTHGVNGMLFESGSQSALAETLEGLLDSPAWMSQLGRQGRQEVHSRYSLARMASNYETIYRELTAPRARQIA